MTHPAGGAWNHSPSSSVRRECLPRRGVCARRRPGLWRRMKEAGNRLDVELVNRGLFSSRAQARAAIEARKVLVDGVVAAKPGLVVRPDAQIVAEAAHPWVSRGGVKLAYALDVFGVSPEGRACLDVG